MKPILLKNNDIVTQQLTDNIQIRIHSDSTNGAKHVATGVVILQPGASTPPHVREVEEIIFVIKDTALIVTTDGEKYTMNAGESIFIPPGIEHFHANSGTETVEQLYIFAPQGPEQGLRDLPMYQE